MSDAIETATPVDPTAPETIRSLVFRPGTDDLPMVPENAADLVCRKWGFNLTVVTPLAHSSGAEGNEQPFMRETVFDADHPGEPPEQIQQITGNSMRHSLRVSLVWLTLLLSKAKLGSLTDAAVHFLWEGGNMGKGSQTLDLEGFRWLVETFPFAGLLGGGTGTSLMHGTLQVSEAILVCQQNAWRARILCPEQEEWFLQHHPAQAYLVTETRTRHDSRSNPLAQQMQDQEGRDKYLAGRFKRGSDRSGDEKSTSMPYTTEVVPAGAHLYWELGVQWATPLEASAMMCGLATLAVLGNVGAKSATGHGRVQFRAAGPSAAELLDGEATDLGQAAAAAVQQRYAAPYVRHVQEQAESIRSWLGRLK